MLWLLSSDIDGVNKYCDMHMNGTMVRLACPNTCNYCMSKLENGIWCAAHSASVPFLKLQRSQCIDDFLFWRAIDPDTTNETTHTCRTITNDEMCAVFSASTYIYNRNTAAEACCRCGGSKYQSVNLPPAAIQPDMSQCKNDDWFKYIGWSGKKSTSVRTSVWGSIFVWNSAKEMR